MLNKAILLATASLLTVSQPARAADYIFGQNGAVPEGSWQERQGGVTQIRLDDGSIVGLVGKARFRISEGQIVIADGAATVKSPANSQVIVNFEGGGNAILRGAASLTVNAGMVRGHVLQGSMTVDGNGGRQTFDAGSAWRMAASAAPARVFANPAQQGPAATVAQLRAQGIRAAAFNGLPVSLGQALGAIGASGDVVQAARAIDGRALRPVSGSLPAGDVERLLAYSNRLAATLAQLRAGGGASLSPGLVDTYLRFLASGGAAGEFQASYNAILTRYLELLAAGGSPGNFNGANIDAVNAYLAYLRDNGLLDRIVGIEQSLVAAYLDYLASGGNPAQFQYGPAIDTDLLAEYGAAISAYLAYIAQGGDIAGYSGATAAQIRLYLAALEASGMLDSLFSAQAQLLRAYLAHLEGGGLPGDFTGFDPDIDPQPGPTPAQMLAAVDGFLDHIKADGLPSEYSAADFETLKTYFNDSVSLALQQAGRAEDNHLLNTYFSYVSFENPDADAFPGLPALGGTVATYAMAQSINRPQAVEVAAVSTGGFTAPLVLDAEGVPVYISNDILVDGGSSAAERDQGAATTSTRVTGDQFTLAGGSFALGDNQGMHFTTAVPLSNVPSSATINYVLDSATSPTFNDGSSAPGTFDAALAVKYDGLQIRMAAEGSVVMPGDATYTFTTPGGLDGLDSLAVTAFAASADRIAIQQTAALSGTGKACVSGAAGCEIYLGATPAGAGANALVLAYGSRNGGAGSVGFTGSAGFVAGSGDDGGDPDGELPGGGLVGAGFDTDGMVAYRTTFYDRGSGRLATNYGAHNDTASRNADGGFDTISRGGTTSFDRNGLALIEQRGDDDVLLTRYGAGTFKANGTDITVPAGRYLDMVAISDVAPTLPVSGTATYLIDDYNIQTTSDLPNAGLDLTIGVAFGPVPRMAAEGVLRLDADYGFATPGGLAGVATSGAVLSSSSGFAMAPFTSGSGDYCTNLAACSLRILGSLNEDFDLFAGTFLTIGGAEQATGVFSARSDDLAGISLDAGAGVASGSLAMAFAHDGQLPLYINAGGSNLTLNTINRLAMFDGVYDDRGLVSLTYNDTNPSQAGNLLFARGAGMAVADLAGGADWQLGRYTGGRLEGSAAIYGPNNGAHYAVLAPLVNAPSNGTINYALKAATRPVYSDQSTAPGTFTGAMAVRFAAAPTVGLEGTVTMPDATYSFQTSGGAANPANGAALLDTSGESGLTFFANLDASVSADTSVCLAGGACEVSLGGQIGGDGAGWASLGYIIRGASVETPKVSGAAVFEGGAFVPDAPPLEGTAVENQITTYASSVIGIDQRQPTTVTYEDATGAPIAYSFSPPNEEPTIGGASLNEAGSVADVIGWARWAGGETGGRYYAMGSVALPADGGWHVVSGTPATNLPVSGTATYAVAGATNPTIRDGSLAPGSATGTAAVAFGATPRVGIDVAVSIGGSTYNIATNGGAANPGTGIEVGTSGTNNMVFREYNLTASGSGAVCGGSGACGAVFTGFLAGEGASHIGLSYTFGNTGFDKQVDGGIVFGKN
ncbi:hypothetical protein FHS61_000694 [Altererythrobacter atlanticus]|uniref:Uncharacterized protein n=1 Tax=Croceibacterium atlanticum TaxID=1267766 RepID=A0A0F7KUR2_9SPHN|nr:hypothetical protein [Croceibacterium atlanticum]AKH42921.1 hypothetical protein WYH_01885 [Croceibacterium atlanticum]MBB5731701.1 hypothetical protein [Croceibacterium atlanticum]